MRPCAPRCPQGIDGCGPSFAQSTTNITNIWSMSALSRNGCVPELGQLYVGAVAAAAGEPESAALVKRVESSLQAQYEPSAGSGSSH
jgi:hypothetical protein